MEELYEQLKVFLSEFEYITISRIQRNFSIGYCRAIMLVEKLIDDGLIEKTRGTRGYKVLR